MNHFKKNQQLQNLKYFLFNFFLVKFLLSFFFLTKGILLTLTRNYYIACRNFSHIVRLTKTPLIDKIALFFIKRFILKKDKNGLSLLLISYLKSNKAKAVKLRYQDIQEEKKKDLCEKMCFLKEYNDITNEKGVTIHKYTSHYGEVFEIIKPLDLFEKYYIVLEPSWHGYCDPDILMFANNHTPIIIQCPEEEDFSFINSLNENFIPIKLGSSYWIDDDIFKPLTNYSKEFDVIYVANWALYKQHIKLFDAAKKLKQKGINLKILLVGFSWSDEIRTIDDIKKEISTYGINDLVTIKEQIPANEVNEYLNKSRISILLSKKEGNCRATTEALAANVPILIYKYNKGGSLGFVNDHTGTVFDYDELPEKIEYMLNHIDQYHPYEWANKNVNSKISTNLLNTTIKDYAISHKEPWTTDILEKVNAPGLTIKRSNKKT